MNNIFLLMKKEWMYLFKYLKSTWIICILFATVFCMLVPQMCFAAVVIVPYYLIYGVMAHEEQCHNNMLNYSLPVTRQDIVRSKYLLGLIYSVGAGTIVTVVVYLGGTGQTVYTEIFRQMGFINVSSLLVGIALFYTGLIIPIILKFGCMKVRLVMLATYAALFGISSMVLSIIKEVITKPLERIEMLVQIQNFSVTGIILLITLIIIYTLSYWISLGIIEKKQLT